MNTLTWLITGGFAKGRRTQVLGVTTALSAIALWAVGDAIAGLLKANPAAAPGKIVIVKSTVPVGTNRLLAERLAKAGARLRHRSGPGG